MARGEHWERLSPTGWRRMAEDWLAENREMPEKLLDDDCESSKVDLIVTEMRFDAPPEKLWDFILLTISLAETDWQFGQIGAGMIEHLLGWNGENYIAFVEKQASIDAKFTRALLGLNQYKMTDEVWARVQSLEERIRAGKLPETNAE